MRIASSCSLTSNSDDVHDLFNTRSTAQQPRTWTWFVSRRSRGELHLVDQRCLPAVVIDCDQDVVGVLGDYSFIQLQSETDIPRIREVWIGTPQYFTDFGRE